MEEEDVGVTPITVSWPSVDVAAASELDSGADGCGADLPSPRIPPCTPVFSKSPSAFSSVSHATN